MALVQHLPAIAMAQKSKIWSDPYYKQIFNSRVEELLLCYIIYSYCSERKSRRQQENDALNQLIVKYGNFHLAKIIGSLLLGEYWGKCSEQQIAQMIENLENNPTLIDTKYEAAREILKVIVKNLISDDLSKIMNVFKSSDIQEELNTRLGSQIP